MKVKRLFLSPFFIFPFSFSTSLSHNLNILSSQGVLDHPCFHLLSLEKKKSDHLNHSQVLGALILIYELFIGIPIFKTSFITETPL